MILLILTSFTASAEIYKWKDENGQTHYGTTPPSKAIAKTVEIEKHKVDQDNVSRLEKMTSNYKNNRSNSSYKSRKYSSNKDRSKKDKKRCEKYKKTYEKYKREGVLGINPITGRTAMMKGEAAKMAIKNAKDNVAISCN